jgi:hypothetical protein
LGARVTVTDSPLASVDEAAALADDNSPGAGIVTAD